MLAAARRRVLRSPFVQKQEADIHRAAVLGLS
jgi:hypothetical protein